MSRSKHKHTCPGPDCPKKIELTSIACDLHWFQVDHDTREKLLAVVYGPTLAAFQAALTDAVAQMQPLPDPALRTYAPRCKLSGEVVAVGWEAWSEDDTARHTCHLCGHPVRFRARPHDTPPYARILPHRTDGTPCK